MEEEHGEGLVESKKVLIDLLTHLVRKIMLHS